MPAASASAMIVSKSRSPLAGSLPPQHGVEASVALRDVPAAIVERTVQRRHASGSEHRPMPANIRSTCGQDMMWQVFAEKTASASTAGHSRSTSSSIGRIDAPLADAGQVLRHIARLPDEVRQLGRRSTPRAGRCLSRFPARACCSRILSSAPRGSARDCARSLPRTASSLLRSRQVQSGPSSAPRPSVTQAQPQVPPDASSAQPNTTGLTTPAPKPITERTA